MEDILSDFYFSGSGLWEFGDMKYKGQYCKIHIYSFTLHNAVIYFMINLN